MEYTDDCGDLEAASTIKVIRTITDILKASIKDFEKVTPKMIYEHITGILFPRYLESYTEMRDAKLKFEEMSLSKQEKKKRTHSIAESEEENE